MPEIYENRADYSSDSIIVYQVYSDAIADPTLKQWIASIQEALFSLLALK